ncbi:ABC transporter permease [Aliidongia dinghuensis]|uniref:ABC transporter permease n=1 Tax=Aliidongia dinghuensis TaxID=1867774 RepID=A0A8J2YX84_9PROT|nr:ABC transporter permease subunit [Aliidongia dinghuensis]GGF30682.1 ABC transporter permease [Aliidongia dinghuensis]
MRGDSFLFAITPRRELLPNRWDLVAFPLIIGLLALTMIGGKQMSAPLTILDAGAVTLDPANLPEYALRTTLRMLAALVWSVVFTLVYGTLAAKSRRAELVLIPILDILQSVPVLSYISFTVLFFMALFPGKVAGAELAAIFAIFTAQAWNMTFSFYQSLRTVPRDLDEASRGFRFSAWQRFWRLEVPFAMPGLIWNMMMSMSGSWFFVVAVEAVTVGDTTITLPGIGAYLSKAIDDRNLSAVGWTIVAMIVVIILYDQLMFRPLVAWADKFRFEMTAAQAAPESWFLDMMRRARLVQHVGQPIGWLIRGFLRLRVPMPQGRQQTNVRRSPMSKIIDWAWYVVVAIGTIYVAWSIIDFITAELGWSDLWTVLTLGFYTLLRVAILIVVASLIWVPLGVMIGLRPKLAERVQPLAQFLAAFPSNLLFPIAVVVILKYKLNPDIWLSPLIILGTQWYILFNVIAGATTYPNELREAADNFKIRGWQWWRKVMLPGIFPYYVTGAITASGGAWNASIVAEVVKWGDDTVKAHGLGAYITDTTTAADYPKIVLGVAVMSFFVIVFNRTIWRPLYAYAERRFRLD